MTLLGILAGLAIAVFFVAVVPWMAITGRRDARKAREALQGFQLRLDHLASELAAMRGAATAQPAESLLPRSGPVTLDEALQRVRESRAKPKKAEEPVVGSEAETPADAGASPGQTDPAAGQDKPFASPWTQPSATEGPMRRDGAAPPKQAAAQRDLEEIIGTRWAIWVGGVALALGSLFLVRFTIEAGLLGPRARVLAGFIFSLGLAGAGEALRRGVLLPRIATGPLPAEHAPLALTAAGTVGLFGTVYAAYALYGLIPQALAFAALGAIGFAAMAASALHGQALAGVGLLASYATPLLIGGEGRSRWPLAIFLLAVTAAGLATDRRLKTRWLGWGVVVGVAFWSGLLALFQSGDAIPELVFIVGAAAIFCGLVLVLMQPRYALTRFGDPLPTVALAGLTAAAGLAFAAHDGGPSLHAIACVLAIVLVTETVVRDGRAGVAIIAAALLPIGAILTWPSEAGSPPLFSRVIAGAFVLITTPPRDKLVLDLFALASAAALLTTTLLWQLGRIHPRAPHPRPVAVAMAVAGGLGAPLIAFAWVLRSSGFTQNLVGAAVLAILTAALATATLKLIALSEAEGDENERDIRRIGAGGFGAGAALALGLGIAAALPGLWMAVGFALAAGGVAALNGKRPLPMLRRTVAAFATTAAVRALLSPVFQSEGALPILNSYLAAYALPALVLGGTAWLLSREARDRNVKVTAVCSSAIAALWLVFTIRHAFHGYSMGDALEFGLGESGLYIMIPLVAALGLFLLRVRLGEDAQAGLRKAIAGLNGLGLLLIVFLALLLANPWLGERMSGWPIFDSSLTGFVAPAVALGALAYFGRKTPGWFRGWMTSVNRNLAMLLGYLYVLTQVRVAFAGHARFARALTQQAEHYAYSAATLAFGVLVLAIGFRLGSRPTRMASAVFVLLAVLKIFLFDLSELEGLLRALSFIGLGAVLIGIGLAYQRLLFDKRPGADEPVGAKA